MPIGRGRARGGEAVVTARPPNSPNITSLPNGTAKPAAASPNPFAIPAGGNIFSTPAPGNLFAAPAAAAANPLTFSAPAAANPFSAPSPTIANPPAPAPVPAPVPAPAPAPVPAELPVTPNITDPVALCLIALQEENDRTRCLNVMRSHLNTPTEMHAWVEQCMVRCYGDLTLSDRFIGLLSSLDFTQDHLKQVLRVFMKTLHSECDRLVFAYGAERAAAERVAEFTYMLAQTALHVRSFTGKPIHQLCGNVLDKMISISQPGLTPKVYSLMYRVLVDYGACLEEHIAMADPARRGPLEDKLGSLYNNIRDIVIAEESSDSDRSLMLELIERRGYGYSLPDSVQTFYESINHT